MTVERWVLCPIDAPVYAISSKGRLARLADGDEWPVNVVVSLKDSVHLYHRVIRLTKHGKDTRRVVADLEEAFHDPMRRADERYDRTGEKNHRARLRADMVRRMTQLGKKGLTHSAIAEIVGCERSNVSYILRGKRWAHLRRR